MTDLPTPAACRRRLLADLREARHEAVLTQVEVADALEWSRSKIIRIENGSVNVSMADLKALLDLYEIVDSKRIEEFLAIARRSRQRSHWSEHRNIMSPRYLQYVEHEQAASAIRCFQQVLIPGPLQTNEYARTVLEQRTVDAPARVREALLDIHIERRRGLFERANPPSLWYIVDESAAHRAAGGAGTMNAQLRHLLDLGSLPNVIIQILPFDSGIQGGLSPSFSIMKFLDPVDGGEVYLEYPNEEPRRINGVLNVKACNKDFEKLGKLALNRKDSMVFLAKLVRAG